MKSKTLASLLRRLRELRDANDLTQEAFAELAGMNYKYYQAVEAGRKKELRISTLEKFAAAYGIELWELLAPQMPKVRLTAAPKRKQKRRNQATATRSLLPGATRLLHQKSSKQAEELTQKKLA